MKDKMLQSFSFKRIKDTGYLAYEMVKNKAVLYKEPKDGKEKKSKTNQIVYEKKTKADTRQVIVVANKALRFKTTKLEYKRTIQYADAKKIDAIKKKKKVKQAVALEYDPSDEAPRVIASGKGILAEKIIEKAQESSVPIHRDDKLADTLSRLDIGEMIPPELYEVVAEILVFVDAVDHRMVKESVANGGKHKG